MPPQRETIAVYVCTHRRNEALRTVLDALAVGADRVSHRAGAVGVRGDHR